jgi:hypothetical protein
MASLVVPRSPIPPFQQVLPNNQPSLFISKFPLNYSHQENVHVSSRNHALPCSPCLRPLGFERSDFGYVANVEKAEYP